MFYHYLASNCCSHCLQYLLESTQITSAVNCVLHKYTISRWFKKFQSLIVCHQEQSQQPFGGPGKIVKLDKTVIFRIKVPTGRRTTPAWMSEITERCTTECLAKALMCLVPAKRTRHYSVEYWTPQDCCCRFY